MLRVPFNGEKRLTQAYNSKNHLGEDYGIANRTAIFSVADGTVIKTQSDIKEEAGKKNWLANYYSDNNNLKHLNDPYVRRIGGLVVTRSLKVEDYGNYIKIDHGKGISTLYAHLDEVLIAPGQKVKEGELIGYSDSSGNSTGHHLHWEIRKNDKCIDPNKFDYSFKGEKGGEEISIVKYSGNVGVKVHTLYVRSGPARTYPLKGSKELHKGDIVSVKGFVEGEDIEGNKFWYLSAYGNYFWAGGTENPYPQLSDVDNNNMTKQEQEAKLAEFEARKTALEARKTELEVAMETNKADIDQYNKDWEAFASEPVEEEVTEPVESVVEAPVEEVAPEVEPVMDSVDQAQEEKISKLEKMYEELKSLLGK